MMDPPPPVAGLQVRGVEARGLPAAFTETEPGQRRYSRKGWSRRTCSESVGLRSTHSIDALIRTTVIQRRPTHTRRRRGMADEIEVEFDEQEKLAALGESVLLAHRITVDDPSFSETLAAKIDEMGNRADEDAYAIADENEEQAERLRELRLWCWRAASQLRELTD